MMDLTGRGFVIGCDGVLQCIRRDGRVVEGTRLEGVRSASYRGFESPSLRHKYAVPI